VRVALIDPPHEAFIGYRRFYYPLGLVSVGSALEAVGHDVAVFDGEHLPDGRCMSNAEVSRLFDRCIEAQADPRHPLWGSLVDRVQAFEPQVIGISVLSCKVQAALMTAKLLRTAIPGAKVVAGGDHCVGFARELAAETVIDAVCVGEGEETARELLQAWDDDRPLQPIRGLVYREGGRIVVNPRRPRIRDLDSLPAVNRSLLADIGTYTPNDLGLMMTSRGCTQNCGFCGIGAAMGRVVRFRSIEKCIEEIIATRDRYGTEYFSFRDGTFTADRERAIRFCRALIDLGLGIAWECLTRADCVDEELVSVMAEANCAQMRLGLESGSPRVLEYLGKNASVSDYEKAASILNNKGMFWSAYFLFGVPEETRDDIEMTLRLIERIRPPFITVARFVPLPGTRLYRDAEALGGTIDWTKQNNMSIDRSYSRHISDESFQEIMESLFAYAADYNRRQAQQGGWKDRRFETSGHSGVLAISDAGSEKRAVAGGSANF
jgi:radical SAM superfamily enzyme YgiQ (UPF0313 family)